MSSPFAAAAAAAAPVVDRVMGEAFEYRPMKRQADVNARPIADPDRAVAPNIVMPWGAPSARTSSGPTQTPGVRAELAGHASARPFVSLQLSRLPYAPRGGDRIYRASTDELFSVAEVLPSTPGFVRLDLNLLKS